jgi:TRAP-type transport system periplasmic protein
MQVPFINPSGKRLVVAGLVWAALALSPSAGAQAPVRLRLATEAPAGTPWADALQEMGNEIRRQTGGRVLFQVFANASQGDERSVLERMRSGILHGCLLSGTGLGQLSPQARILELPFFYRDQAEFEAAAVAVGPEMEREVAGGNCVLLGWFEDGSTRLWSTHVSPGFPAASGRKIWVHPDDPLREQVFKLAGFSGATLAPPDVMPALETGAIDSVCCTPAALVTLQWHTRMRSMSPFTFGHRIGALLITADKWQGIGAEDRDTVRRIAREHLARLSTEVSKLNDEALRLLEAQGVKAAPLPAVETSLAHMLETGFAEGPADWLYSRGLFERVRHLRDAVRAGKKP